MRRQLLTTSVMTVLCLTLGMTMGDDARFTLAMPSVFAHCDTMDGPVVKAAQQALATGDVSHVLIWVQKTDEAAIREAFDKTLTVRKLDPRAGELADMYFFETLVRLHRAGEGAPYEGIMPAGSELEPGIAAADKAVEAGDVDKLVDEAAARVADGIRERFETLMEKKQHAGHSVDAGREYVAEYVTFIHYVEAVFKASAETPRHGEPAGQAPEGGHEH